MATSKLHPIIRPPEQHEVQQSPVRDDLATGPTEDLDRQPDGVPHQVVGMTALFSVMLAMLLAIIFVTGKTVGHIAAVVLAVIAIPVLVSVLRRRAARDRDHLHPSR
jgi:Flp pilus assembly protein TadB